MKSKQTISKPEGIVIPLERWRSYYEETKDYCGKNFFSFIALAVIHFKYYSAIPKDIKTWFGDD